MWLYMFVITSITSHTFGMDKRDTLSIPFTVNCSHTIECSQILRYSNYDCNKIEGIPADTSLYRIYNYPISENDSMLILLAKDSCNLYYCSFDTNRDDNFNSEYKYYFTKEQILTGCDFIPQIISFKNGKNLFWQPVFPIIFINSIPRKRMTITTPNNLNGFILTVGTGTYFYSNFNYRNKAYSLALRPSFDSYNINTTKYCLYDTLMLNNNELFDNEFRNVSNTTVYGNTTFKIIDVDFQKQQYSLLVNEGISSSPYKNAMAPLFNVKDINGKNIDLAKLRGKYVLIDFWGSWCNPCIAMIPKIKKIHEDNSDLIVISIAHDQVDNTLQETRKIIAEKGMDWINIYQCDKEMTRPTITTIYNINLYPTTILIDPQGKIIYRGSGNNKYNELNTIIRNECNIQHY